MPYMHHVPNNSIDVSPLWQVPLLAPLIPRQCKALEAVELIRRTTEDLIARCCSSTLPPPGTRLLRWTRRQHHASWYAVARMHDTRTVASSTSGCCTGARRWWMQRKQSAGAWASRRGTSTRRTPPCCAFSSLQGACPVCTRRRRGADIGTVLQGKRVAPQARVPLLRATHAGNNEALQAFMVAVSPRQGGGVGEAAAG